MACHQFSPMARRRQENLDDMTQLHLVFLAIPYLFLFRVAGSFTTTDIFVETVPSDSGRSGGRSWNTTQCGGELTPCGTIREAFERFNCSQMQQPVQIVLRANVSTGCRIANGGTIRIDGCRKGLFVLVARQSSCASAVVVDTPPQTVSSPSHAGEPLPVIVVNLSQGVFFRNLTFPQHSRRDLAVRVVNSTAVGFEGCVFGSSQITPALELTDTYPLWITNSVFRGKNPPVFHFKRADYEALNSVVKIHFTRYERPSTSVAEWSNLVTIAKRLGFIPGNKPFTMPKTNPGIQTLTVIDFDLHVLNVTFDNIGLRFRPFVNDLAMTADKVTGGALAVIFNKDASNHSMRIQANFSRVCSPRDSALFIEFRNESKCFKSRLSVI